MWKDNYKRRIVFNIVVGIFSLLLLAVIALSMISVIQKDAEEDKRLAQVQTEQKEQQVVARQEGVAAIEAEYQKDLATLQEYLPGIVCWGDSITAGSSGNTSYPYILQKYIDTYICDVYNFRLSIENAADYSRLKWNDYKISIPVINMGGGRDTTGTILGRCGVVPYVISEAFTLPADCTPVPIKFTSQGTQAVAPLAGGDVGINNVTINGVEGKLTVDNNNYMAWAPVTYSFTRTSPGESMQIDVGTEIITAGSELYKDYIHVVCIGTYKGYETVEELVNQTKLLVQRQTKNSDRYIVLGMCSYDDNLTGGVFRLDVIESAMSREFGNRFINVRKYLCEDGLSDYGLTPTGEDRKNASNYVVPESLRSAANTSDLNGRAYELIGKLVYDRMDRLGYFDEIREELYINEAITQLLKEDPMHFSILMRDKTSLLK